MNSEKIMESGLQVGDILDKWEFILGFLFAGVFALFSFLVPYFLNVGNLLHMTLSFMEKGLIAFPMALIIITGNIDLSVASNMAMSAAVLAISYQAGVGIWVAVLLCLLVGLLGGLFNGLVITKFKIPAIVATLGTYSMYRGISYVLLRDTTITGYPEKFSMLGRGMIGGTAIPYQLLIFIVFAAAFWVLLHKTPFGRRLYAMGNNEAAARYSGVSVERIKLILFSLSGLISSFAGFLLISRIGSTRPDIASGFELEVITAVVLGGVSITGGSGRIAGVVISLFLIGTVRYGMKLMLIPGQGVTVVIGILLIVSILISNLVKRFSTQ